MARRFPLTPNPFAGYFSPKLAKGIRALLLTPRVQEINFDFGSVLVHSQHFREISRRFVDRLGDRGIHTIVHPSLLIEDDAGAVYISENDAMYFELSDLLDDEEGRSTAIHELVHAVCDYRRRVTAVRSEEGAAILAEVWYRLSGNDEILVFDYWSDGVWEVASRLRERWYATHRPVPLRGSEINMLRLEAAKKGYDNGYYSHDGMAEI